MTTLLLRVPDPAVVTLARLVASTLTFYDGRNTPAAQRYIRRCTHYHAPTETMLIYTRDAGMHASGWWKNPDYDRCLHLSLSFAGRDGGGLHPLPFDRRMAEKWARLFFGDDSRWLWIEPPFSPEGKARGVHHYRLFCDSGWQPIKPRGEVYSRDWTPANWLSWSDLHGTRDGDGNFGAPNDRSPQ